MIEINDRLLLAFVGTFLMVLQFFFYFITKYSNKEVLGKIDELVMCVMKQNEKLVKEIQTKREKFSASVSGLRSENHDILTKVITIGEDLRSTSSILLEASLAWKSNLLAIEALATHLKEHSVDCKDRNRDIIAKVDKINGN